MNLKRLPLKGIHNLRDLGGYPIGFDKATKWRTFYRADGLFELDGEDIETVKKYCKMGAIIDLRGSKESTTRPNSFLDMPDVKFYRVPLISEDENMHAAMVAWKSLNDGYLSVAKLGKKMIKQVFDIIYDTLPEPVLFHCTAGKDRTGIISCLLLGAAGVDFYDIIVDYEVSSTYIRRDVIKMVEPGDVPIEEYMVSPSATMRLFIDFILENHGSILNYLLDCGIEEQKIQKIVENFTVDICY